MTQCDRIREHLERCGSITAKEAFEEYGIMRLGARVYDLMRSGVKIRGEIETGKNRYGEKVHWVRYYYVKEEDR